MKKRDLTSIKKILAILLTVCLCVLVLAMSVNLAVIRRGGRGIREKWNVSASDTLYDCILVLGAGLRSDGSPSDMLADRLRGAVELYERGVSHVILLSGDRSGDYDEVAAMAKYCLDAGVPAEAIACDFEGFSTYESVCNTIAEGYDRFVIVTQRYHLYRALYIADGLGAEAVGFSVDYRSYRGQLFRDGREAVARIKDFILVIFS